MCKYGHYYMCNGPMYHVISHIGQRRYYPVKGLVTGHFKTMLKKRHPAQKL